VCWKAVQESGRVKNFPNGSEPTVELKIRRYPVAGYPFRNSFSRRISLEVLCERTPTVLSKSTEREADRVLRLLIFRNSSARVSETLCLTRRDSDRNRRLAPLSIDNVVELRIKTYSGLHRQNTPSDLQNRGQTSSSRRKIWVQLGSNTSS